MIRIHHHHNSYPSLYIQFYAEIYKSYGLHLWKLVLFFSWMWQSLFAFFIFSIFCVIGKNLCSSFLWH